MMSTSIDSQNADERIAAMTGIKCASCLDSGMVQTWVDGQWRVVFTTSGNDEDGKPIPVIKKCDHGQNHGF